jgi:GNAT superfamily N-acetyltransferase
MILQPTNRQVNLNSESIIRSAEYKDTRKLAEVLAHSFYNFPDYLNWIYPLLQITIGEDLRYRLRFASPLYHCLVASIPQANGEPAIAGTVEISLRSPSFWTHQTQYPYISNLAVHKNYRRQGIGSKLLAKCEQIALDWGYNETHLHVLDNNHSAQQLYSQNGYSVSQIEPHWGKFLLDYSHRLLLKKQIQLS